MIQHYCFETENRLYHAFNFLDRLKNDITLGEYLRGTIKLNKQQIKDLLNYYINLEEYEICQKIVNGSDNIINT